MVKWDTIRFSKVPRKTGAEFVSSGIGGGGRNLETKQKVPSQISPHSASVGQSGTSRLLNLRKANWPHVHPPVNSYSLTSQPTF